jgi:hypothetical protein
VPVAPEVQLYVNGAVPPEAFTVDEPLHRLHPGAAMAEVAVIAAGDVIFVVKVLKQLLASVTITVYIPLHRLLAVFPNCPLLQLTT